MKVATHNNSEALKHLAELYAVIQDAQHFGGLSSETRYFFATVKERLKADESYLANNLRAGGAAVYGYEAYSDDLNVWAS
jgi:hypothetical protein